MNQLWFRSDLFHIDPKEDEATNPFCYGKALAQWIKSKFTELGYAPEEVIAEDWGWCVMLDRSNGQLWIGCGNVRGDMHDMSEAEKSSFLPDGGSMTWTAFVGADKPTWSFRIANRRSKIRRLEQDALRVASQLETLLKEEPRIFLVDEA